MFPDSSLTAYAASALPFLVPGMIGFVLFFLYDINSYTLRNRLAEKFFFAGTVLVAAATILCLISAVRLGVFGGGADAVLIVLAVLSFAAMIYSLFFALPFTETYVTPDSKRCVYDKGAYALCRHPGALFFFTAYLFLGLAALPSPFLFCGMIFSALNFVYICFQDRVTFPKTFVGYEDYRQRVPFIIPTYSSICLAFRTLRHDCGKEDGK